MKYEYDINDYKGNEQSKKETIDGETAVGEYKTLLPDGKRQIVTYESGPHGHLAHVAYEQDRPAMEAMTSPGKTMEPSTPHAEQPKVKPDQMPEGPHDMVIGYIPARP